MLLVGAAVLGEIVGVAVGAIDGAAVLGLFVGAEVGAIDGAAVLGLFVVGAAVVHTDTAQNGPDGDDIVL